MDDTYDDPKEPRFRRQDRHGRLGIASFAIGVITVIWEVCVVAAGMTLGFVAATQGTDPEEWMTQLVGFGVLVGFPAALVGIVLGGVAATLPHQKKLFAFLGIGANALVFIGICGLFVIGIAFG
jgi:hypothetical protein